MKIIERILQDRRAGYSTRAVLFSQDPDAAMNPEEIL